MKVVEVEAKKIEIEEIDKLKELFEKLNKVIAEELMPNIESSYKLFSNEIEKLKQKIDEIDSKQSDAEIETKINEVKLHVESEIEKTKRIFFEEIEKLRTETRNILYEHAATINSKLDELKEAIEDLQINFESKTKKIVIANEGLKVEEEYENRDDMSKSPRIL
ncbi:hypothetical protein DRP05_07075 [Archaeoglobales archaeon]|nr:MAG: hypothetical protein DRP05_07075 [Archaeoglobales archaeon]